MVKQGEYFFDCHCHTMTLGHINISSFLENLVRNSDLEILMGIVGGNAGSTTKGPASLLDKGGEANEKKRNEKILSTGASEPQGAAGDRSGQKKQDPSRTILFLSPDA